MKFEILVADDHAIIRDGLKKILADTDDLEVVGEAGDGSATLQKVRERDWDLVILDLSMPGRNGIELIKMMKDERPKLKILVFSMHPEDQYAVRTIRAGASGYLSKEENSDLSCDFHHSHACSFFALRISDADLCRRQLWKSGSPFCWIRISCDDVWCSRIQLYEFSSGRRCLCC